MPGTHDFYLVSLSILIAVGASYTALDLSNRATAYSGRIANLWSSAAAVALGCGIWSMHFVAMLAFKMPGMAVNYDFGLTLVSFVLAVAFTGIGFAVIANFPRWRGGLIAAGALMGLGVVAMHYVGMAGMKMTADIAYDPLWVAISVLIALSAATAALWIVSRRTNRWQRLCAAAIMGLAISGMHYAAMRGATFTAHAHVDPVDHGLSVTQASLAITVTAVIFVVLMLSLGASTLDRRLAMVARREARGALRLRLTDVMRDKRTEAGIQEAAALMGAHFRVSRVGYGELDAAGPAFDYRVCWTDGSVPPLLGRYPADAFGVKIVAALNAGETVVVDDLMIAAISDEDRTKDTAVEVDTRAILVVPFLQEGRLTSIFYLNSRTPRHWTRDEIKFMEELAERTRQVIARAEVEEKLRDLNATLEARIEERTDDLRRTELALRQSQKMEAIGQLTGGLAHDFNNLLAGISGSLELMEIRLAQDRTSDIGRYMTAAQGATTRAAALTHRLLAFSRRQTLDPKPTDVNRLIDGLAELIRRTVGPSVDLAVSSRVKTWPVLIDPSQLENAILNLCINARDAMPEGGRVVIETMALRLDASAASACELIEGEYVTLSVTDTGSGMSPEIREKVFEPFFTTKPIGEGTGLGLSMIYGFAKQSGGAVTIVSAPGEGTTVCIYLPRHGVDDAVAELAVQRRDLSRTGQGETVLVVDDEPTVRFLVTEVLQELGYKSIEAEDGVAGLKLLQSSQRIDLLISDVGLPGGMNGRQMADAARQLRPDLKVLFITGYAETAALGDGQIEQGMAVMTKPFSIEILASRIREMIAR